ncbi:MBG domain-containing protein [Eggerthella sp. YY7918]|uniref:MBG domain-containing protein n=1 Tax=Eggerthella sp. (strain YY7918) TaxID=502558 RepID=UPI0013053C5E|nr:MBG domain-containing protein [Eggerthella sp. YY7918]
MLYQSVNGTDWTPLTDKIPVWGEEGTFTFNDLDKYVADEDAPISYKYKVVEESTVDGYATLTEGTAKNGYTITNQKIQSLVITADSGSWIYDGQKHEADGYKLTIDNGSSITVGANGAYTFSNGDKLYADVVGSATNVADTAEGNNEIKNVRVVDKNNRDVSAAYSIETANGNLEIKSRPLSITGFGWTTDQPYTGNPYTSEEFSVEQAGTDRGLVAGQATEGLAYKIEGTNVGDYTGAFSGTLKITSEGDDVTANYTVTTTEGTLKIVASEIAGKVTLTPKDASKVYDGTALPAASATAVDTNNNPVVVEYSTDKNTWTQNPADITATQVSDTKTVYVRASVPGVYEGYVEGTQTITITTRPLSITGFGWTTDQPYTGNPYTSEEFSVEQAGTDRGLVAGQATEGLAYKIEGTNVGDYTGAFSGTLKITSEGDDVTANYTVTTTEGTLKIVASEIAGKVTLTPKDASKVYDGTALPAASATAVDTNNNPVVVEYSTDKNTWTQNPADITATQVSDTKTVYVRASVPGVYEGYVEGTQTITITPVKVTITVNNATKVYGDVDPTFTGTIAPSLVNDADLGKVTYARVAADANKENVGDDITLTAAYTPNGNYEVTVIEGKLTITPSDTNNIVATGITKYYDGEEAYITATAAQPNSTIEYSLDGQTWRTDNPTYTDVSTNTVQVRATNPNFETVTASADVVINPAPITVTANSFTKVVGAADPELTYTFTNAVNGETPNFTGALEREAGEGVGTYAINQGTLALADGNGGTTGTTFKASNYTMAFVAGALTITPTTTPPVTPPTPPVTPPATPPVTPPVTPPGTVPPDSPIAPVIAPVVEVLEDAVTPLAGPNETEIDDNGTPLANQEHPYCWVHFYLILGIIVSVIYGACVALRRSLFSRKLKKYEDNLTGGGDPAPGTTTGADNTVSIPKGAPATAAVGLGE